MVKWDKVRPIAQQAIWMGLGTAGFIREVFFTSQERLGVLGVCLVLLGVPVVTNAWELYRGMNSSAAGNSGTPATSDSPSPPQSSSQQGSTP